MQDTTGAGDTTNRTPAEFHAHLHVSHDVQADSGTHVRGSATCSHLAKPQPCKTETKRAAKACPGEGGGGREPPPFIFG